jgi:hypothetical protein
VSRVGGKGTAGRLLGNVPWIIPLLLIPSWMFWFLIEREDDETDHLLFFYMPDLVERPLRLIPNLTLTPFVNTENDQIVLITVLIAVFGTLVERRLGLIAALAVFWGTSSVAAIGGAVLFHLLHPLVPEFGPIASGAERVFNGASAGGYGLMGAFAATTRRPFLWLAIFAAWEPTFWWLVDALEFTPVFHVVAFATGIFMVRGFFRERLRQYQRRGHEGRQTDGYSPSRAPEA